MSDARSSSPASGLEAKKAGEHPALPKFTLDKTSSPELDRFLVAMLRASGGSLVIQPHDSTIMKGEILTVTELQNGGFLYKLEVEGDMTNRCSVCGAEHDPESEHQFI